MDLPKFRMSNFEYRIGITSTFAIRNSTFPRFMVPTHVRNRRCPLSMNLASGARASSPAAAAKWRKAWARECAGEGKDTLRTRTSALRVGSWSQCASEIGGRGYPLLRIGIAACTGAPCETTGLPPCPSGAKGHACFPLSNAWLLRGCPGSASCLYAGGGW
jgi:hypothetical protein